MSCGMFIVLSYIIMSNVKLRIDVIWYVYCSVLYQNVEGKTKD